MQVFVYELRRIPLLRTSVNIFLAPMCKIHRGFITVAHTAHR